MSLTRLMETDRQVLICQYRNCLANGSAEVLAEFLAQSPPQVEVIASECQGQCNVGVTVRVLPEEVWYCRVKSLHVMEILQQHLDAGQPIAALLNPRIHYYGL